MNDTTPGRELGELAQLRRDVATLAQVGRLYLDSLDADPENECLTLVEALRVTEVREAVERQEARWGRVTEDLMTGLTIARAVETCAACPSQWDAWTDTGQYLYLRYRGGIGTVDTYPDNDSDQWTRIPDGNIASFDTGDSLHGSITLAEFCELAGLTIAEGADLR